MASSKILRVPRTDSGEDDAYILGEVTSLGSKPLNVKLVATEGEEPYVVKLRHDRIGELRASNSPCSPDEWEAILKAVLLGGEPVEGIEAGAEAHVGKTITITIRRRVAGINQRLGAITLNHKADEAIQLFDWCGSAALEREQFKADLAAETAKVEDLDARVTELKDQLDELTQAKKVREAELLEKLCGLLNEKKVKIREQQLLLKSARMDESKLAALEATRPSSSGARAPKASRSSKRKVPQDVSSDESDDGFEKMDVDQPGPTAASPPTHTMDADSDVGQQTPDEGDDATASEDEEDEEPLPKPTRATKGKGRAARSTASPPARTPKGKGRETLTMHPKRVAASPSPVPSPAKAAVTRHRAAAASAAPPPANEGSETESDDEL